MKILRNYVLGELCYLFTMTLAILTFLLVCGNILTKMADLVINWGVDILLLIRLFIFSTPFLFNFTLPMSALVAVLLTFGKMSADHELIAIRASGISFWKVIQPVLLAALILTLVAFWMNDQIAPESHYKVRRLSAEIGMKKPASILEEGVFIKQFKNLVIFIHKIQQNSLEGIRILQPQEKGSTRTIVAEKGTLVSNPKKNIIKLKLFNGTTDEPDPKHPGQFYKLHFDAYMLPLDLSEYKFREPLVKKPKEMTTRELRDEFKRLRDEHGFVSYELLTEIHRKIALSLSVFVFALLGIPLAITAKRSEKSIGFAIALFFSILYWALSMGVSALARTGNFPPALCLQIPNAVFLGASLFMLRKLLKA